MWGAERCSKKGVLEGRLHPDPTLCPPPAGGLLAHLAQIPCGPGAGWSRPGLRPGPLGASLRAHVLGAWAGVAQARQVLRWEGCVGAGVSSPALCLRQGPGVQQAPDTEEACGLQDVMAVMSGDGRPRLGSCPVSSPGGP